MGVRVVLWWAVGATVGLVNAAILAGTIWRLDPDSRSSAIGLFIVGYVIRYILTAGILVGAVRQGIGPALAAAAGLLMSRWVVVLWGCSDGAGTSRMRL